MHDVVVIGGGPSGIMAAIAASKKHKVLLIEKNNTLGKKLLLTGGGRCNVTNNKSVDFIIANIIGNGKFLYSAFSKFDNQDIINFFNDRNVELKEEDNGRMFPSSNSSITILNTLIQELNTNKVTIKTNTRITKIETKNKTIEFIEDENGNKYFAEKYILCTGGKTFPQTGSTGDGYKLAKSVGHTITKLIPSEVPLISNEKYIKDETLKGISLKDIELKVINDKNKVIVTHTGDMIFTHFGISGPAVLRCSSFVLNQNRLEVPLLLDCLPNLSENDILNILKSNNKSLKNNLKEYLPTRFIEFLLNDYKDKTINEIKDIQNIIYKIKNFKILIHGSLPMEKAFVTGGGISLKEIDPKTMKSKIIDNLYFAGEVMDIHGYTGGYNITAALVSGYLAGEVN